MSKEEQSRALARVLAASRGSAIPPALFKGAAKVFAKTPPPQEYLAAFWELFPPGRWAKDNGGTWLHMLNACGAVEALVRNHVTPTGGVAGWFQRFVSLHKFISSGRGVTAQPMPAELYDILPSLAPRLRAENQPINTWSSQMGHVKLDAELLSACLAHDIPVQLPPRAMQFSFLRGPHLRHLFKHPVLGPRVEQQISYYHHEPHHMVRPGARSAIGLLPDVPEVVPLVRSRAEGLVAEIGGAGLPQAVDSLRALDCLLDPAAITALEGIEDELADLDPVRPLLRALRSGLPEELGWPAFDAAVAELGDRTQYCACVLPGRSSPWWDRTVRSPWTTPGGWPRWTCRRTRGSPRWCGTWTAASLSRKATGSRGVRTGPTGPRRPSSRTGSRTGRRRAGLRSTPPPPGASGPGTGSCRVRCGTGGLGR